MKTISHSSFRGLAGFFIVMLTLLMPLIAPAAPMPGSYKTGVVQSVDHASRHIVFQEDGGKVHSVVYTPDAHFWHDAADSSLVALKAGMHVKVRLHHPFFGPEFVRDISLLGLPRSR